MHQRAEGLRPTPRVRAYAGRLIDVAPPARANTAAIAGAALSLVPFAGIIPSILGLTRAQALGGAGRTVATVGLVFSVVFTVGEGVAAYELTRSSTRADPACAATRAEVDGVQSQLADDAAALSGSQAAGDPAAASAAADSVVTDLRGVKATLERNVGRATHTDVRVGIQTFDADLGTLISAVRQVASGSPDAFAQLQASEVKLRADGQGVDELCAAAPVH